jgi:cytoskeletal protein CcmA (bactofilin family)
MRTFINVFLLSIISYVAHAGVYNTVRDGMLNSRIWEGGFIPNLKPEDTVFINHSISYDAPVSLVSVVVINENGNLNLGANPLVIMETGKVIVNGRLKVSSVINKGTLVNNGKVEVPGVMTDLKSMCLKGGLTFDLVRELKHAHENVYCTGCFIEGKKSQAEQDRFDLSYLGFQGRLNFKANYENEVVKLYWDAILTDQLSHFEIEKSYDAKDFRKEGIITPEYSASGKFFWEDQINESIITYYRLKLVDNNGQCVYSRLVSVVLKKD